MSYSPFIPQPNDKFSQSQQDLLNNFTNLDIIFDEDHYKFSDTTNKGLHKKISFPEVQTVDPGATSLIGNLYTKDVNSVAELFFQNATKVVQLTNPEIVNTSTHHGVKTLWGITINWGTVQIPIGSQNSATTSFAVPFTTAQSMTLTTIMNTSPVLTVQSLTSTTFIARRNSTGTSTLTIYYFAIGV